MSFLRHSFVLVAALLAMLGLPRALAQPALSRVLDDVTIHLGVTPLAAAAEREAARPSEVMHDHKRIDKSAQHVVIALYETKSGQRITDARVSAKVTEVGLSEQDKPLVRMTAGNAISWGNTFEMKPGGQYTIKVVVWRPGVHTPAEATFNYSRP